MRTETINEIIDIMIENNKRVRPSHFLEYAGDKYFFAIVGKDLYQYDGINNNYRLLKKDFDEVKK